MKSVNAVPVGVKVISVLYYIGAVLGIIFVLFSLFGAGVGGVIGWYVIAGIIMIPFAVLAFFIGRGLWKAKSWARIVAIVFAIFGMISALTSMVQGNVPVLPNIFGLAIHLIVGGYLLFNGKVKQAFA